MPNPPTTADLQFKPAEFQALPLNYFVATPLMAAVEAMSASATATKDFIEAFKDKSVDFELKSEVNGKSKTTFVHAPLLSVVPVPHLRIDSLTTHFRYEVTQTIQDTTKTAAAASGEAGTTGLLSKIVSISLRGSLSRESTSSQSTARSGVIEITVHASEAEIPRGLDKLLTMLAAQIPADQTAPEPPAKG